MVHYTVTVISAITYSISQCVLGAICDIEHKLVRLSVSDHLPDSDTKCVCISDFFPHPVREPECLRLIVHYFFLLDNSNRVQDAIDVPVPVHVHDVGSIYLSVTLVIRHPIAFCTSQYIVVGTIGLIAATGHSTNSTILDKHTVSLSIIVPVCVAQSRCGVEGA